MKKIILSIALLTLLMLSACSSQEIQGEVTAVPAQASPPQDAVQTGGCPRGIQNDPAPGLCILYTDENSNGFCDYGE